MFVPVYVDTTECILFNSVSCQYRDCKHLYFVDYYYYFLFVFIFTASTAQGAAQPCVTLCVIYKCYYVNSYND